MSRISNLHAAVEELLDERKSFRLVFGDASAAELIFDGRWHLGASLSSSRLDVSGDRASVDVTDGDGEKGIRVVVGSYISGSFVPFGELTAWESDVAYAEEIR